MAKFTPKYKVGDKVKIVDNKTGHNYAVGEVLTIENVDPEDDYLPYYAISWFGESDCAPEIEIDFVAGVNCLF